MTIVEKGPWEAVNAFNVKRRRNIVYRVKLLDGGKHVMRDCKDVYYERPNGEWLFLNTAKNVSYMDELRRAAAK